MLLLAADTTTTNGSVALADAEGVMAELRLARQEGHSSGLLPAIEFLLQIAGRQARDVDAWAVAVGPGSFTGLRVGISTIQGLALAAGKPCVGVSALQAWALGVAGCAESVCVLLCAFRQDVYFQLFDGSGAARSEPGVGRIEEALAQAPAGAAFVGDAAPALRSSIESACSRPLFPSRSPFLAAEVAALAAREAAAGRTLAPDSLRPLYLREAELRKSRQA